MVRQRRLTRFLNGLGALVLVAGITAQIFLPGTAFAAPAQQITSRSLTLEPGATAGGSAPGIVDDSAHYVNHLFKFTLNDTTDNLGSIVFQYCTTAAAVTNGTGCVAPVGIDTTNVTLGANTGVTGWTTTTHEQGWDDAHDSVNNAVLMTRTTATSIGSVTPVTIELDNIVNPSTPNETFFVRIWTFTATTVTFNPADGTPLDTADANDSGTVAAATANPIVLTGTMPESLVFCTGHTVDINASGVPDCTTATSGSVSFNQLFSPSTTSWAYSQMAAATNASSGYAITVAGPTMTSGGNTITAIGSSADISRPGTLQFGMNLIDDYAPTSPTVTDPTIGNGSPDPITYYNGDSAGTGGAINPVSDGTNYNGIQEAGFDGSGNASHLPTYSFAASGNNTVAKSDYSAGGATGSAVASNTQRYTSTYIVNVSGNLPAGSYTTTLTYICTPTF